MDTQNVRCDFDPGRSSQAAALDASFWTWISVLSLLLDLCSYGNFGATRELARRSDFILSQGQPLGRVQPECEARRWEEQCRRGPERAPALARYEIDSFCMLSPCEARRVWADREAKRDSMLASASSVAPRDGRSPTAQLVPKRKRKRKRKRKLTRRSMLFNLHSKLAKLFNFV